MDILRKRVKAEAVPGMVHSWPGKSRKDKAAAELKAPVKSVDVLAVRRKEGKTEILLGRLDEKWSDNGKYEWGVPGREIRGKEGWKTAVLRSAEKELGCKVLKCKKFCVNDNYALGNHYIVTGVIVEIAGEPKVLMPADWKEWKWFPINKMPEKLFPSAKNVIDSYLKAAIVI